MNSLFKRKAMAVVLSLALVFQMGVPAFAAGESLSSGASSSEMVCTHHEHNEDCGYVAGTEGSPCTHRCEKCATDGDNTPAATERIAKVQTLLDALPTLEDVKATTDKAEQNKVYTDLQTAYDAYEALTPVEQGEVTETEVFEPLFTWFNSMTEILAENVASVTIGSTTTEYDDFQTAWDAATATDTSKITLLANITTSTQFTMPENKTMTIDLNGQLWTDTNVKNYSSTIVVNGNLTINDTNGNGGIKVQVASDGGGYHRIFTINAPASAKLTINAGNFEVSDGQAKGGEVIYSWGQLYVNGGTFKVDSDGENVATMRWEANSYFKISGGNFTKGTLSIGEEDKYDWYYEQGGKGDITGGSFAKITLTEYDQINIRGILPIGANFVDISTGEEIKDDTILNSKSIENVTIKSVVIILKNPTMDSVLEYQRYTDKKLSVVAEKSDSSASGNITYQWYQKIGDAEVVEVVDANQAEYTLPENLDKNTYTYFCKVSYDGITLTSSSVTFEVKDLPQVAGVTAIDGSYTTYSSMQLALDAATDNTATITLLEDVSADGLSLSGGTITLNLNGKKIETDGSSALLTLDGADVTIENGRLRHSDRNPTIKLTSGNLLLKSDATVSSYSDYNYGLYVTGGTATIDGASFVDGNISVVLQSGNLIINSGSFGGSVRIGGGKLQCKGGDFATERVAYGNKFSGIEITDTNQTLADLLTEGYAFRSKAEGKAWVSDVSGKELSNVTVEKAPVSISAQPQDKTIYYGYTNETLPLTATAVDSSKAITYQWYSVGTGTNGVDEAIVDATTNSLTIPQGKMLEDYQYYCKVTCDGYTLQSSTATVTVAKSATAFEGGVKTYKDSTETTTFTYGDTIMVKVTPKATGTAPTTKMARTFAAPAANQMALFANGEQICEPVSADENGGYTMSCDTANKGLSIGSNTITAKYVGNANMADYNDSVTVTLSKKAITFATVNTSQTKVYDGNTNFTDVSLTLNADDILSGDTVTATANGTVPDANVGTKAFTATSIALGGDHAAYYTLVNSDVSGTVEITTATPTVTVTAEKKTSLFRTIIGDHENTIVLTATIVGVNGENPAGSVVFKNGATTLGTKTTTNGIAIYELVNPTAASYTITAEFTATANTNYGDATGTSSAFDISKAEQKALSITVPSKVTYGDAAFNLATSDGSGEGAVIYAVTTGDAVSITSAGEVTILKAGTATITATKAGDTNYNPKTGTVEITVQAAAPILTWGAETQTTTYTGNPIAESALTEPTVTLLNSDSFSGTIQYAYKYVGGLTRGLFEGYTDGLPTNAGKYEIKAHIDAQGNYTAADSTNVMTLTIEKSTPSLAIHTMNGKTYDGTAVSNPAAGDMTITGANYANVTFAYSKNSDMSSSLATAPKDAGTYYVQASVKDSDNTNAANSVAKSFEITKASVTGVSQEYSVVKGLAKEYDFTLANLLPSIEATQEFGKITYAVVSSTNGDVLTANPSIADGKLKLSVANVAAKDKTASVTINIATDNFTVSNAVITVKTVDKKPLAISNVAMPNREYDAVAYSYEGTPTFTDNTEGKTVTGVTFTKEYEGKDGTSYTKSTTAPTNAGSYNLILTVSGEIAKTYAGTLSVPFTITKKQATAKPNSFSIKSNEGMPALTWSLEGVIGSDTIEATNKNRVTMEVQEHGEKLDAVKVGTFDIVFATAPTFDEQANYTVATGKGVLTVTAYTSGGGGGSSSGGGSSTGSGADNSTITTPPATTENPKPATEVSTTVKATVSGGTATVNVSGDTVNSAIQKAQDAAKKNGTTENGIVVEIKVDTKDTGASSLTASLPKASVDALVKADTKEVRITSGIADIHLNLDTLKEVQKQVGSDVSVAAKKVDNTTLSADAQKLVGNRPVFDFSITGVGGKKITDFGNGNVSVSIPYTLGTTEVAANVVAYYIDSTGKVTEMPNSVYDPMTKTLNFVTNHFSHFAVGYKNTAVSFTDTVNHWAKDSIEFVAARGILAGTGDKQFSPNTSMTRGMFVTALGRLAEADVSKYTKSSFSDVKAEAYYMGYVEWAVGNGMVNGIGNGKFAPDQSITREQMAVMTANYAKAIGYALPRVHAEKVFADQSTIGSFAKDAVKQMQMAGILSGKNDNRFDPQGTATRAEGSTVLKRFIELVVKTNSVEA